MNSRKAVNLFIFIAAIAILSVFSGLKSAEAASLYFSPSEGNFYQNENFKVGVYVSSDQPINAVQGAVNFPTKYIEAVSVANNGNSIIDLWVTKPSFSNAGESGNVYFEGVVLNPGFAGSAGKVMDVTFRIKKEGPADVNFSGFAVLANDGLGTNLATNADKASFVFLPPRAGSESAQPEERIKSVEEKLKEVEEKIKSGEESQLKGILGFWRVLPNFIRVLILIFISLVTVLLSIVLLGFIAVILTWLWEYFRRRRRKIEIGIESLPRKAARFLNKILKILKLAEKELEGDVKYGAHQLKKDFIEAETSRSLKKTLVDYWHSLRKIFKRFTTKNVK